jgi:cytoskeleton protein RodZ
MDGAAPAPATLAEIAGRLRAARERSGVSVELAAERLHCDVRLLRAIEDGRFDELGAPVFARGHIRRYGDLLGERGLELADAWARQSQGSVNAPDLTQIAQAPRRADPNRLRNIGIAAGVATLLIVGTWLILSGRLGG